MSGWNAASQGWSRRGRGNGYVRSAGWRAPDILVLVVAFAVRWELGLAFLGLKLWHQASGSPLSTLGFAREKWERLVDAARGIGTRVHLPFELGDRPSGSPAFDRWRAEELARIDAERGKLRAAEHDFMRYRDDLLRVKDREDFDRFMRSRDGAA